MSLVSQYALALVGILLLGFVVRGRVLRTWLGIALVALGFGVMFVLPPNIGSIDVEVFALSALVAGISMFSSRRQHEE